ncbi:MAG: hypothetical protein ACLUHA_13770 [Bacteroides stercoris]
MFVVWQPITMPIPNRLWSRQLLPAGYKPFYLSHYARHGSRFLINPDDYEKPLAVMREADENGVLTELGKKTLCVLDSVSRMAKSRYGELTPLGARQHKGIAERMYKNFPEVFKGEAEVDACSTVVIRCILFYGGRMFEAAISQSEVAVQERCQLCRHVLYE